MRRSARWSIGSRWIVAIVAALGLAAVLAPRGDAQTLTDPLPELPVETPPLPSLPLDPVSPVPAPAPAPVPALPEAPTVVSPLPSAPAPALPQAPTSTLTSGSTPLGGGGQLTAPGPAGSGPITTSSDDGVAAWVAESTTSAAAARSLTRRLSRMSPRQRRAFLAHRWGSRLKGKSLKRLRTRLLEHWSCQGILSSRQRRAVILRAGLFGHRPATWRAIARTLHVSLARGMRLVRSGVPRLTRAGMCIDAGGAALGTSAYPRAPGGEVPSYGPAATPKHEPEVGDVRGVFESSAPAELPLGLSGEDADGAPRALLAFLAVLLALLAALAAASRRVQLPPLKVHLPPVFPVRSSGGSGKPLLFLDVDGVISLPPYPGPLPPGEWHHFDYVHVFVSDRAGEFVRALATRYEIVWATGWEHEANRYFRPLLGLEEDLRVLKFGREATFGTAGWKIKKIARAAGERPAACVDDHISLLHEGWANEREAPTLLVETDPSTGITEDDVKRLLRWADSLEPVNGGRSAPSWRSVVR